MALRFDPTHIDQFKARIRGIPGYPVGEDLPVREMIFESGAIWRLPDFLLAAGIKPDQILSVVMDRTLMKREGRNLKELLLQIILNAGLQFDVVLLEPDSTGQVHTDFAQINFVKARLRPNSAVMSVGSGTVTDIAKHACYLYQQEQHVPALPLVEWHQIVGAEQDKVARADFLVIIARERKREF